MSIKRKFATPFKKVKSFVDDNDLTNKATTFAKEHDVVKTGFWMLFDKMFPQIALGFLIVRVVLWLSVVDGVFYIYHLMTTVS